jgi:restriction endonuclease Mrr
MRSSKSVGSFSSQREVIRREFRYRCGFCGVAETISPGRYWVESHLNTDPVYVCGLCHSANSRPGRLKAVDNRSSKSYFRHLRFEPDGRLANLTPHGELLIISLDLNHPAKVRLRSIELKIRKECREVLQQAPPLIAELLDAKSLEHLSAAKHLWDVLRVAQREMTNLPEPIDSAYSREEIDRFDCVSAEQHLTPYLINHLKRNPDDLLKIQPRVFEDLVAEFFAAQGFEVHLVGRDSRTGADVLALKRTDPFGLEIRMLIEVKRWRNKVGIEEIRKVAGALALERHKHGWHLALLVSAGGFKHLSSTTPGELSMLGIELRDQGSLLHELRAYKPRLDGGLWLTYGWEDCLAGVQIK